MHGSAQWNYYYSLLEAYYKEHGNIDIPNYFKIDGIKVGLWLEYQKQAYRGKNGYVITQERIERLEELGIHWSNKLDVWDRYYSLLEEYYKEHGDINIPQSYEVNGMKLGRWLCAQRKLYKDDRQIALIRRKKLEKLGMKWNPRSNNWEEKYSLLEEYYKEHGNIDVPQSYEVDGIKLGIWLCNQRSAYRDKGNRKLTKEQIEKLEKLGMKWNSHSNKWKENYTLLKKYYKEHGNIDVPQLYEVDGVKLGLWIRAQRQLYQGKGNRKLTKEQIEKLEKLGMKWELKNDSWEEKYALLEKYYKEHGNIDIPQSYEVDGIKLGIWLCNQRSAHRGIGKRKIKSEQIEKLEKLGIKWNHRSNNWEEKYSLLKKYYKEHGNIDVPPAYEIDGIKLGAWVITQRQAYKGNNCHKITPDQIEKLEKLGMKWDSKTSSWEENYVLLEKYYEEHGDIDVPQLYEVNGVKLGRWLGTQRQAYKGNNRYKITPNQIEKLENLGMKWNSKGASWKEKYALLEEYYKEHGNIDVPQSYEVNGVKLGRWLHNQQNAYRGIVAFTVSDEHIKFLNKLGVDWNPAETKKLNNTITDMEVYNTSLLARMDFVLRDIKLDGLNMINSKEEQKEIEKIILKRLFK